MIQVSCLLQESIVTCCFGVGSSTISLQLSFIEDTISGSSHIYNFNSNLILNEVVSRLEIPEKYFSVILGFVDFTIVLGFYLLL